MRSATAVILKPTIPAREALFVLKAMAVASCEPKLSANFLLLHPTDARCRWDVSVAEKNSGETSGLRKLGMVESSEADWVGVKDAVVVVVPVDVELPVDVAVPVLVRVLVPEPVLVPVEDDVAVLVPVRVEEDVRDWVLVLEPEDVEVPVEDEEEVDVAVRVEVLEEV